jgi:cytoskeleton protein RodZ
VVDIDDSADNAAPRKTAGQTLAAERERQGLSRADVAQRLHMSAWQVEALETGDYARLPKGTFLRGFVRNYAKVLGLAPETVLGLLPEDSPRDRKPGIVVPTQNIRFDPMAERLQNPYVKATGIAVSLIAVGFAVMYWWLFIKPKPPGAATHAPAASMATAPASAPVSAPVIVQAPPMLVPEPAQKSEAPKPAEAKKAAPPPATAMPVADPKKAAPAVAEPKKAEPVRAAGSNTLKFVFKGASWVEIRDAAGRILMSKLNAPGSETEYTGKPPFNIVVGNAPDVQLFYNDREFDLEPHTKVAVARFTVE